MSLKPPKAISVTRVFYSFNFYQMPRKLRPNTSPLCFMNAGIQCFFLNEVKLNLWGNNLQTIWLFRHRLASAGLKIEWASCSGERLKVKFLL